MIDLERIIDFDKTTLLTLNGSDSLFWDGVMSIYTTTFIWLALGAVFLYVVIKNNSFKNAMLIFAMIGLTIVLTDQLSSGLCKPYFQRFRPTNDPQLMYLIDTVNGYRGGQYGFISGHATNSFGIVVFALLIIRNKLLSWSMIVWALLNCFSRIYLGVHYLGDILAGIIGGILVGFVVYAIYLSIKKIINKSSYKGWISNNYTKTGYLYTDIQLLLFILYLTYAIIPILAIIWLKNNFV